MSVGSIMSNAKENDDPNPPALKKSRLSLSRNKKQRFTSVSHNQLTAMAKPSVPKNTEKSSRWALGNLRDWFEDNNGRNPDNPCPSEILTSQCTKDILDKMVMCIY